jgi:hypothetical protein
MLRTVVTPPLARVTLTEPVPVDPSFTPPPARYSLTADALPESETAELLAAVTTALACHPSVAKPLASKVSWTLSELVTDEPEKGMATSAPGVVVTDVGTVSCAAAALV